MYGIDIEAGGESGKVINLSVNEGAVITEASDEINKQAYILKIKPSAIEITGNSEQGLLYGVQTLVQLVKQISDDDFLIPAGVIRDWPAAGLRFLHWDTKHHQDRMETSINVHFLPKDRQSVLIFAQ